MVLRICTSQRRIGEKTIESVKEIPLGILPMEAHPGDRDCVVAANGIANC